MSERKIFNYDDQIEGATRMQQQALGQVILGLSRPLKPLFRNGRAISLSAGAALLAVSVFWAAMVTSPASHAADPTEAAASPPALTDLAGQVP